LALGLLFILMLAGMLFYFSMHLREFKFRSVLLRAVVVGTGPFWGTAFGIQPNVHGLSVLVTLLYVFLSWGFSIVWLVAAGWKSLRMPRDHDSTSELS
jgi:hypothetical protein